MIHTTLTALASTVRQRRIDGMFIPLGLAKTVTAEAHKRAAEYRHLNEADTFTIDFCARVANGLADLCETCERADCHGCGEPHWFNPKEH